ncbi:MAG: hypothetical protein E6G74_05255 [Alphaproteobacteria bacterium]|nr:MAG: hypothetical protein E6G74_05255 [Alphaproteobacteria bacterium]
MLKVSWHKTPLRRRRGILVPGFVPPQDARVIRSETRALLIASIARGRRWLNELIVDPGADAESIATRDGCSVRKVNMTISLAFLAPDLVKAAIEGRLPHGMGVVRLADLPAEWSRQHQMLELPGLEGLKPPTNLNQAVMSEPLRLRKRVIFPPTGRKDSKYLPGMQFCRTSLRRGQVRGAEGREPLDEPK